MSKETYHLIGIGGAGMRAIATLLLEQGHTVKGSDIKSSRYTQELSKDGAKIHIGHKEEHIGDSETIIYSSAIPKDNPELRYAKDKKLKLLQRAEALDLIMSPYKERVAIAGTHGKTTTTSMLTTIAEEAKIKPAYMIGADRRHHSGQNSNAHIGGGNLFITEADESDGSFLSLNPTLSVITNIENDHLNFFQSQDNLIQHFKDFIENTTKDGGTIILNHDDAICQTLEQRKWKNQTLSFGFSKSADIYASTITHSPTESQFLLHCPNETPIEISLQVLGTHNIANALAAAAAAVAMGISSTDIAKGLMLYKGAARRFQNISCINDILIVDDYAHHPTEIQVTLDTAKTACQRRCIAIFQPHRYSRTQELFKEFSNAFADADIIIITDIFAASEAAIPGITAEKLVEAISKTGKSAVHIPNKSEIPSYLEHRLFPGDIVITMGAGDIWNTAHDLTEHLSLTHA